MIVNANNTESEIVSVDVCIVGGGPAGLEIALELAETDLTVALLESGSRSWNLSDQTSSFLFFLSSQ